jgi:hopene-associated glycosyltransferase HpnB
VTASLAIACMALIVWIYLIFCRGGFWLAGERDDADQPFWPDDANWPTVAVIIPARDEAAMLPQSLGSILAQDYPKLSIILVDDNSSDGTAAAGRQIAAKAGREAVILKGQPLPAVWTGKLWALHQGISYVETTKFLPDYLLLTDADIHYAPCSVKRLVARAKTNGLVLTSLMAKLHCESFAERALIPAFVFFFQMLYPFAWVNDSFSTRTAAAAGGCMLVDRLALEKAGGVAKVRGALIDDCALAKLMKAEGPIWLGLSDRVRSLRKYPEIGDIDSMVARSAYTQLRYSPLLLTATLAGMAVTYIAPPLLAIIGRYPANAVALVAWALMVLAFLPILRSYRLSPLWAAALPLIAATYSAFTLNSACEHCRGRGGTWKGRSQVHSAKR